MCMAGNKREGWNFIIIMRKENTKGEGEKINMKFFVVYGRKCCWWRWPWNWILRRFSVEEKISLENSKILSHNFRKNSFSCDVANFIKSFNFHDIWIFKNIENHLKIDDLWFFSPPCFKAHKFLLEIIVDFSKHISSREHKSLDSLRFVCCFERKSNRKT